MKSKYLLKEHMFHGKRVNALYETVKGLKETLEPEVFKQHPTVKLAARIRRAECDTIPDDPNRPDYRLSGDLRKYRRYKQGLSRYRVMFCFANEPIKIILYLYINTPKNLRKAGDKNDPYEEFKRLVRSGTFGHDPQDKKMKEWVRNLT